MNKIYIYIFNFSKYFPLKVVTSFECNSMCYTKFPSCFILDNVYILIPSS